MIPIGVDSLSNVISFDIRANRGTLRTTLQSFRPDDENQISGGLTKP